MTLAEDVAPLVEYVCSMHDALCLILGPQVLSVLLTPMTLRTKNTETGGSRVQGHLSYLASSTPA